MLHFTRPQRSICIKTLHAFTFQKNYSAILLSVHSRVYDTSTSHSAGGGQCSVQQAVLPGLHLG